MKKIAVNSLKEMNQLEMDGLTAPVWARSVHLSIVDSCPRYVDNSNKWTPHKAYQMGAVRYGADRVESIIG